MEQKKLAKQMKWILAGFGLCGLMVYLWLIPTLGKELVYSMPEFAHAYVPWLGFLLITAVPCYIALIFAWRIAANIGVDRAFCPENGNAMKWVSRLALGDAVFFFAGNIVLLFVGINHPGILLMSLLIVFVGVSISVAAGTLSHLIMKAAVLQEQSDFTI